MRKYARFDLDVQPAAPADLGPDLRFLHDRPGRTMWAITQNGDGPHTQLLSDKKLLAIVGLHPIAPALNTFAARPQLQKKIRSRTGCYLDLGDFAVPIAGDAGVLCHFLSDQQWLKHWLVYCGAGSEIGTVLVADRPYGFKQGSPRSVDLEADTDLEVCADSFEEFLYRFWVENELSNMQRGESFSDPEVERYARQLENPD